MCELSKMADTAIFVMVKMKHLVKSYGGDMNVFIGIVIDVENY